MLTLLMLLAAQPAGIPTASPTSAQILGWCAKTAPVERAGCRAWITGVREATRATLPKQCKPYFNVNEQPEFVLEVLREDDQQRRQVGLASGPATPLVAGWFHNEYSCPGAAQYEFLPYTG